MKGCIQAVLIVVGFILVACLPVIGAVIVVLTARWWLKFFPDSTRRRLFGEDDT